MGKSAGVGNMRNSLIPKDLLFGSPRNIAPIISPDGTRLAYLAPIDNILNVWIARIDDIENKYPLTYEKNSSVHLHSWTYDGHYLLYLQDKNGRENWRIYSLNTESGETMDLTPFDNTQARILSLSRHAQDELLITLNKDDSRFHDVYSVNSNNGTLSLIEKNFGDVIEWWADARLQLRGALAAKNDGSFKFLVKKEGERSWNDLVCWGIQDTFNSWPVSFSYDGEHIFLCDSRFSDTNRLVKVNMRGEIVEILAHDAEYDIGELLIEPNTQEIQAVSWDKNRNYWKTLDRSIRDDFGRISKLENGDFSIISRDIRDDSWIVKFVFDNKPSSFYYFDRRTKEGRFLFCIQPDLKKYALGSTNSVSFIARDGLRITGYVTYPQGNIRKRLPLVIKVHGGPWRRDKWGFDNESQWLVNLGYACMCVNFRGSSGFGKSFLNAGNKEWGRKMVSDLVDAAKWAVGEGIADQKKIAIFGTSFGGYASLIATSLDDNPFCCGVDIAGPTNLISFIESVPPYWSSYRANLYHRVGHPDIERELLMSQSPISRTENLTTPLFIAHGQSDVRVKFAESQSIVEKLKQNNTPCKFMAFPDEGHIFNKAKNRLELYSSIETFLDEHLGTHLEYNS